MRRLLKFAAGAVIVAHVPLACRVVEAVCVICNDARFNGAEAARNVAVALSEDPS